MGGKPQNRLRISRHLDDETAFPAVMGPETKTGRFLSTRAITSSVKPLGLGVFTSFSKKETT